MVTVHHSQSILQKHKQNGDNFQVKSSVQLKLSQYSAPRSLTWLLFFVTYRFQIRSSKTKSSALTSPSKKIKDII